MIEKSTVLSSVANGLEKELKSAKFSLYYPKDADRKEFPEITENNSSHVLFSGSDDNSLMIEFSNKTVGLYYAESAAGETQKGDYTRLSASLLDVETADDSDIKYIIEDFSETISSKFSGGKKPTVKKLPNAVSKAAVRNGAFYDIPSFGSRLTATYPELREEFRININTYGEFLPEEFFKKFGTPHILSIIKDGDPTKLKKLFNLLNEIYDNGTNDVQSLIVVSILGELKNDETLIARCVDYMSDELCVNVIRVNKYLYSAAGKSARMRLENPPRYKPKKQRKSLLSSMMGGNQNGLGM